MRLKWIALTFMLGMIVILDPTQMPAQPGGGNKGGGKGFNKGGGGGQGGGAGGGWMGGGGQGGGWMGGGQAGGGGGGWMGGGQGGGMRPPGGGGGGGGPPGGGRPGGPPGGGGGMGNIMAALQSPDAAWVAMQQATNSTGDVVDLAQLNPYLRGWLRRMADNAHAEPLPEVGTLSKGDFLTLYSRSDAVRRMQGQGGDNRGDFRDRDRNNPDGTDKGDGDKNKNDKDRKDKKDAEDERPVAIRYGKLPKGLPQWFEDLDLDKDGQVALWEWRKGGRSIAEFKEYDLNDDGVITADEYLRGMALREEEMRVAVINAGEVKAPPPGGKKNNGNQKPDRAGGEGDPKHAADQADKADKDKDDKSDPKADKSDPKADKPEDKDNKDQRRPRGENQQPKDNNKPVEVRIRMKDNN